MGLLRQLRRQGESLRRLIQRERRAAERSDGRIPAPAGFQRAGRSLAQPGD